MSRTLSEQLAQQQGLDRAGTARSVTADDLDGKTVDSSDETTVYANQVPSDALFAWGAGTDSRTGGRSAFVKGDFVDDAGNTITGDLEAVITDSRQRDVLARYNVGDLGDLSAAASDDRTDRPMQPVVAPAAREDRYLELRIKADADSDGSTLDPSASDVRFYYTDIDI